MIYPRPILGQEAVTPDGLGRVMAFHDAFPHVWVQVSTYVNDRQCKWSPHNVRLVPISAGDALQINDIDTDTAERFRYFVSDPDAERFRYFVSDPETGRHLLSLLSQGKGDADALRRMIDRIQLSKAAADAKG